MAKMALLASYFAVNGADVSAFTSKVELTTEVEEKDVTTFASLGWKEVIGGIKSGSVAATFKQDIAAAQIDSQIWALFGTVVTFEIRLSNAVVGTSNPKYTGTMLVRQWAPISGSVGDVAEVSVTWPTSAAVVRGTS